MKEKCKRGGTRKRYMVFSAADDTKNHRKKDRFINSLNYKLFLLVLRRLLTNPTIPNPANIKQ